MLVWMLSHVTDEDTESWRDEIMGLNSHSEEVAKLGLKGSFVWFQSVFVYDAASPSFFLLPHFQRPAEGHVHTLGLHLLQELILWVCLGFVSLRALRLEYSHYAHLAGWLRFILV